MPSDLEVIDRRIPAGSYSAYPVDGIVYSLPIAAELLMIK